MTNQAGDLLAQLDKGPAQEAHDYSAKSIALCQEAGRIAAAKDVAQGVTRTNADAFALGLKRTVFGYVGAGAFVDGYRFAVLAIGRQTTGAAR